MRKMLFGLAALVVAGCVAALAADPDVTSRERWRVLVDTNATTTVTLQTATAGGQLLSGKVGGTNAVWISTAAGTNGWVKIAQQ